MNTDFRPILVVPAVPHEDGIRFLHRNEQLDIGPEYTNELWQILEHCNGYNNVEEIAQLSDKNIEDIESLLAELIKLELVTDSREQYLHFHRIHNYPTCFDSELSQDEIIKYTASARAPVKTGKKIYFEKTHGTFFDEVLPKRRSCRNFSDAKLSLEQIGNICHYGYYIQGHTVPSGGALYPLKIYVLIEKEQDGIAAGYYEYDAENDNLILFNSEVDIEQLKYCFNQEEMPFGSSVQVIIAADLKRQTYKYANRGYMLTLIEVGHVAENISLYCAEQGLGACEMGGVLDEPLKDELQLEDEIWPIITIPIGKPADTEIVPFDKMLYVEKNTGDNKPVKNFWARTFGKDGAFFGAATTYKDYSGAIQYSGATSTSYVDAVFKATIEGHERYYSGQIRIDKCSTAEELDLWLDPRKIAPLTPEQAKACGVKPFDESLKINWTLGRTWDGQRIYVPSDLIFYGSNPTENQIYFGHSSGIAAHTDYQEAIKRATIELIERDALMRNWYKRESPNILNPKLLPIHVRKRKAYWEKYGRKMYVLQMPSDYGWVFETIIVSDEYPTFVSGAAATLERDCISDPIIKSVQEAEYILLLEKDEIERNIPEPEHVLTPTDHGKIYYDKKYLDTISWLWSGNIVNDISNIHETTFEELQQTLGVVMVDITERDSKLKVVRVFSPKLVPINFGYNSAHYTHSELAGMVHPDSIRMPHYFA